MARADALFRRALAELRRRGVLLKSDTRLPAVTTLAAGGPIRGSWWGHPKAGEIFATLERLADHPDVLLTKLVSGKDTFVHRELWPCLLAVVLAAEAERLRELGADARRLFRRVQREGTVTGAPPRVARELESRLLVLAREYHTDKGAHAKRLHSWRRWAERAGVGLQRLPEAARARERLLAGLASPDAG